MSIGLILQNGLSGLQASQAGLATISQNVANANTVGYSRQIVSLEQRVVNGISSGVSIGDTSRVIDNFLTRELQIQQSNQGEAALISDFYNNIQTRFGTPGGSNSLSADLSRFGAALETLSINPEDPALRFNVVSSGVIVARSISELATSVQILRSRADTTIDTTVDEINAQLKTVFDLNRSIARVRSKGGNTAAFEDQRDLTITALSKNIAISTFHRTSGEITILAKGGLTLLDTELHELDYTPAASVNDTTGFGAISVFNLNANGVRIGTAQQLVSGGVSSAVTSTVNGGRLKGLLDIRDKVLPNVGSQVTTLANTVRNEYNAVHNSGSSFPAVNSLTGTRTVASGDTFTATGNVRIAVVNANGTLAANAVDINLTATGTTTVGALVTTINTALGANGSASIVNGKLVITATNSTQGIAINTNDSLVSGTTEGFPDFFGLNDFFTGTGSSDFAVRADIVTDPSRVSMGKLSLTATSGQSGIAVGDNTVITNLAALTQKSISFAAVTGLPAGTFTMEEYAGLILGLNAVQAARAEEAAALEGDLLENLEIRKASQTGVNVDEELANILVFQNAYAASARVINAAQELFDSLLAVV